MAVGAALRGVGARRAVGHTPRGDPVRGHGPSLSWSNGAPRRAAQGRIKRRAVTATPRNRAALSGPASFGAEGEPNLPRPCLGSGARRNHPVTAGVRQPLTEAVFRKSSARSKATRTRQAVARRPCRSLPRALISNVPMGREASPRICSETPSMVSCWGRPRGPRSDCPESGRGKRKPERP